MNYYNIPDVAGWQPYYREPLYYRLWISASTLPTRMDLTDTLVDNGLFPFQANGKKMRIDPLKFINMIDNPDDPNAVINEFARVLFPKTLLPEQVDRLKEILIPACPILSGPLNMAPMRPILTIQTWPTPCLTSLRISFGLCSACQNSI